MYGDDSCPNQLQSQSSPGGLGGATGVEGQRDGKFWEGKLYCYACRVSVAACNVCVDAWHVLVGVNVSVIMCILVWIRAHVCVAPPMVVGAWPMVGTLWRLFEYYCYYYYLHYSALSYLVFSSYFSSSSSFSSDVPHFALRKFSRNANPVRC